MGVGTPNLRYSTSFVASSSESRERRGIARVDNTGVKASRGHADNRVRSTGHGGQPPPPFRWDAAQYEGSGMDEGPRGIHHRGGPSVYPGSALTRGWRGGTLSLGAGAAPCRGGWSPSPFGSSWALQLVTRGSPGLTHRRPGGLDCLLSRGGGVRWGVHEATSRITPWPVLPPHPKMICGRGR
jgi:hypothetical protein